MVPSVSCLSVLHWFPFSVTQASGSPDMGQILEDTLELRCLGLEEGGPYLNSSAFNRRGTA